MNYADAFMDLTARKDKGYITFHDYKDGLHTLEELQRIEATIPQPPPPKPPKPQKTIITFTEQDGLRIEHPRCMVFTPGQKVALAFARLALVLVFVFIFMRC